MTKLERTTRIAYNNYEGDDREYTFKNWEKGEKSRIYMSDYKGRTIGYIDRSDEHFELIDKQGLYMEEINKALETFKQTYC